MTGLVVLVGGVTAGFAVGYAAAHVRPLHRLDRWAFAQDYRRAQDVRAGRGRRRLGWYAAQVVFAVEIAAAFAVRPRRTAHLWRHRDDPPPLAEAPRLDPDWAAKRTPPAGTAR